MTFECSCSRLQLEDESRYPGTCRSRTILAGTPDRDATAHRTGSMSVSRIASKESTAKRYPRAVGDFILKRRDQVFAYVLAVVVDDAAQGVTHIVRGADLAGQHAASNGICSACLGLPQPSYAHVPVLTEPDDSKLAKSRRSVKLRADRRMPQLLSVFSLLGLAPPDSLGTAPRLPKHGRWAIGQWDIEAGPETS